MLDFMREYDLKRKALRADDRDKRTFERIGKRDGLLRSGSDQILRGGESAQSSPSRTC
jgi:hypothetical protein